MHTQTIAINQSVTGSAPQYDVLGVRVNAVSIASTIAQIESWIANPAASRWIAVMNVHMVMTARSDADFGKVVANADMAVPDGMPLIWMGRKAGFALPDRVAGPDLFAAFMQHTQGRGYRHFFYGGMPATIDTLIAKVKADFPETNIVGSYSPPFRPLSREEDDAVVSLINDAAPDVIWVGLGCPKQERWMEEHRDRLNTAVMLGVGQVFDIYAGTIKRAPKWMQRSGLEWLYRLCSEPRRLWRRYLVYNTRFVAAAIASAMSR